MKRSKGNGKFTLAFIILVLVAVGGVINSIYEHNRREEQGCKPTGEQKFRNWGDRIKVQDKLVCRDGHVEWADAD